MVEAHLSIIQLQLHQTKVIEQLGSLHLFALTKIAQNLSAFLVLLKQVVANAHLQTDLLGVYAISFLRKRLKIETPLIQLDGLIVFVCKFAAVSQSDEPQIRFGIDRNNIFEILFCLNKLVCLQVEFAPKAQGFLVFGPFSEALVDQLKASRDVA